MAKHSHRSGGHDELRHSSCSVQQKEKKNLAVPDGTLQSS